MLPKLTLGTSSLFLVASIGLIAGFLTQNLSAAYTPYILETILLLGGLSTVGPLLGLVSIFTTEDKSLRKQGIIATVVAVLAVAGMGLAMICFLFDGMRTAL